MENDIVGPVQAIPLDAGGEPRLVAADPKATLGGIMQAKSLDQVMAEERAVAEEANSTPYISALAGHIRKCWEEAKMAKEERIEPEMLAALRQRKGEYDPDMLMKLRQQGSSEVYMMITSNKCRSAAAWLREALVGMPWSATPTPVADIDNKTKQDILQDATKTIFDVMQMGIMPGMADVKEYMLAMRDKAFAAGQETAKSRAERMTEKMKDQLIEGGFQQAMDQFIEDLVTFPAAILKGPVVRKRGMLKWVNDSKDANKKSVVVEDAFRLEWERVDPFNLYPSPASSGIDDGYLIERHKLSRADLSALRDVDGYSVEAINAVLDEYGRGGLMEHISVDSDRLQPENKPMMAGMANSDELIEVLEFWGSVQGKMLIDWGIDKSEVDDPLEEYHIEAWLVGRWVIKAIVNPDPLHRKPYYKTSWESVPGAFWGRSIPHLCRAAQDVCNAAARALVNNMSLASGPQVMYDVTCLPRDSNLSEMYPWKIWQYEGSQFMNASVPPISFFQPDSNAAVLMQVYERYAELADEYTGIPRYMTGDANVGGAGRTASGMSMLMSNAGKTIKNVVASIDAILKPAIERLYMYNMLYLDDPELKGDVNIQVEGANSLMLKQQQQQKLVEFLNVVTTNPALMQLIGDDGIAYLLRQLAMNLGLDTDKIIPAPVVMKAKRAQQALEMQQAMIAQQLAQQQAMGQPQAGGTPAKPGNELDQRRLMNGEPQANTMAAPKTAPQVPAPAMPGGTPSA